MTTNICANFFYQHLENNSASENLSLAKYIPKTKLWLVFNSFYCNYHEYLSLLRQAQRQNFLKRHALDRRIRIVYVNFEINFII